MALRHARGIRQHHVEVVEVEEQPRLALTLHELVRRRAHACDIVQLNLRWSDGPHEAT
jgi:hypothetical protein